MKTLKKIAALVVVFTLISFLPVSISYSNPSQLTWNQFVRSASQEKLRNIAEIMLRKFFDAYNNNDINTMMEYIDPAFSNPQGFKAADLPLSLRTVSQLVDNVRLKLEGIDDVIIDRQSKQILITVKYRWTRSMTDADTGIVLKSLGQDATITLSIKPQYSNGTKTARPGFSFIKEAYAYEGTPTVKSEGWGKENAQKQADKIKQETGKNVDVAYEFNEKPSGEFEIKYVRSGDALSAKPRKIKGNDKNSEVYKTTKAIWEGKGTPVPSQDAKAVITPAPASQPVTPAAPSAADAKAQNKAETKKAQQNAIQAGKDAGILITPEQAAKGTLSPNAGPGQLPAVTPVKGESLSDFIQRSGLKIHQNPDGTNIYIDKQGNRFKGDDVFNAYDASKAASLKQERAEAEAAKLKAEKEAAEAKKAAEESAKKNKVSTNPAVQNQINYFQGQGNPNADKVEAKDPNASANTFEDDISDADNSALAAADIPPSFTSGEEIDYRDPTPETEDTKDNRDFTLGITITDLWGGNQTFVTDPQYNQISNDAGIGLPYVLNGDIRWVFWAYVVNPSVKSGGYNGSYQLVELTPDPAYHVGANGVTQFTIPIGSSVSLLSSTGAPHLVLGDISGGTAGETAGFFDPFVITVSANINLYKVGHSTEPISDISIRSLAAQQQCFVTASFSPGDIFRADYRSGPFKSISVYFQMLSSNTSVTVANVYVDYTGIAFTKSA